MPDIGPQRHLPFRFQRPLAWLADWALFLQVAALHAAWALPWYKTHEDLIPWPWEPALPVLLALLPLLVSLGLILGREFGPWRCSLGMAWAGLRVVNGAGEPPGVIAMFKRRLAWWLNLLSLGLGFLPAFFGHRRAVHDRLSGTLVTRAGATRFGILLPLLLTVPFTIWGSVRWVRRQERLANPFPNLLVGYLNRAGKVVIPPRFRQGKAFRGQRAVAWILEDRADPDPSGFHLIDPSGKQVSGFLGYRRVEPTENGCAVLVNQDDTRAYYDRTGKPILWDRKVVGFPDSLEDPLVVQDEEKHYYLFSLDGQPVGERSFGDLTPFVDGVAGCWDNGYWGLVDRTGRTLLPARFGFVMPSHRGLLLVQEDKLWGFTDRQGQWLIPPQFKAARIFEAKGPALAAATLDGEHFGYIGLEGTWAIEPRFRYAKTFTEAGWARVKVGNAWGVIDVHGSWVLPPEFEEILAPREAPFTFRRGRTWGYVAPGGKVLVPPILTVAGPFKGGFAFGQGLKRWIRFDAQGHGTPLPGLGLGEVSQEDLDSDLLPFWGEEAP